MRNVTIWSLLTLLSVLAGGGTTLLIARTQLDRWGRSGVPIPLGQAYALDLPAGDMLVYYESSERVPMSDVLLAMRNADGLFVDSRRPTDENSFRLTSDGWSGRALWEYRDLPAGEYTVVVNNSHYESNEETPEGDRVVFGKEPNTVAGMHAMRRRTHVIGMTITLLLAAGFYGVHLFGRRAG